MSFCGIPAKNIVVNGVCPWDNAQLCLVAREYIVMALNIMRAKCTVNFPVQTHALGAANGTVRTSSLLPNFANLTVESLGFNGTSSEAYTALNTFNRMALLFANQSMCDVRKFNFITMVELALIQVELTPYNSGGCRLLGGPPVCYKLPNGDWGVTNQSFEDPSDDDDSDGGNTMLTVMLSVAAAMLLLVGVGVGIAASVRASRAVSAAAAPIDAPYVSLELQERVTPSPDMRRNATVSVHSPTAYSLTANNVRLN